MICYLEDVETEIKRPMSEIQLKEIPSIAEYQEQWVSDAAQVRHLENKVRKFNLCLSLRIHSGDKVSPHSTLIPGSLSFPSLTARWRPGLYPGLRPMERTRTPGTVLGSSVGCVTSSSLTGATLRVTS